MPSRDQCRIGTLVGDVGGELADEVGRQAQGAGLVVLGVVTTYEHTLVRQLAEDLPDTHVRYINRSEIPPGIALAERYKEKMSAVGSLSSVDESAIDDLLGPRP
ncbi:MULTISPECIES: hypothetical protein [unclassified Nocardioides]|uniref:hypothetical protein n=1 Tax=unclassified Nocardioides TaxID=2615069 RepID=UPI000057128E|nr:MULTISPECIES: hypothetical protein [unclassified Nocardioides]